MSRGTSPDPTPIDRTRELLERWYDGDAAALDELLRENLSWLRARVRAGPGAVRPREGTEDVLQTAMVDFLRNGPRFLPANQAQFRALMGRILDNAAHDRRAWFQAACRDMRRERDGASGTTVDLALAGRGTTTPSRVLAQREAEARGRLALELLPPDERDLVAMRTLHDLPFREIAKRLDISPDAVRMRYKRAILKVSKRVRQIEQGDLSDLFPKGDAG